MYSADKKIYCNEEYEDLLNTAEQSDLILRNVHCRLSKKKKKACDGGTLERS